MSPALQCASLPEPAGNLVLAIVAAAEDDNFYWDIPVIPASLGYLLIAAEKDFRTIGALKSEMPAYKG